MCSLSQHKNKGVKIDLSLQMYHNDNHFVNITEQIEATEYSLIELKRYSASLLKEYP